MFFFGGVIFLTAPHQSRELMEVPAEPWRHMEL